MNKAENAKIILAALEEYIQIDSSCKELYIKGILKGLAEIEKQGHPKEENYYTSSDGYDIIK
ncbi:hypothetical protein F7731_23845 [Cytobacillus depressus]|uniref:Uncharacterized protein n=1 Tax=Cytobacillus depressus TaxID=1602942 RepID=A0A6L3UZS3_9BACI|nr:hypothetical protein [Cytobacillus depressus]KAB2328986.1 hypothetical protein F7731_23845 [Cytobacillus depressus]